MSEMIWQLPCLSQEFHEGPKIRQEVGDQLVIAYDFESAFGGYGWEEIVFTGVVGFRFTAPRYCSVDQVKAYDKVETVAGSGWTSEIVDAPLGLAHYRMFFDDAGAYEVLATGFVPPPEAP